MRHTLLFVATLVLALFVPVATTSAQFINEIRIDQAGSPGNNDANEYFELRGQPGTPLKDLSYVVLGSRPIETISGVPWGGAGVIVHINKFPTGAVIPPSGIYFVRKVGMVLPLGVLPNLTIPISFEDDSTQTHLLVRNFAYDIFDDAFPPNVGFAPINFDLDLNNDGVLDMAPWGEVIDAVSLKKQTNENAFNRSYALVKLGPASDGIPAHAFRCGNSPNWQVGRRQYEVYVPSALDYQGPTNQPFDAANPYSHTFTLGEANGPVRFYITLRADMDESPDEFVQVSIGGQAVGTLTGGFTNGCTGPTTRVLTMTDDAFNILRCSAGSDLQVTVTASAAVEPCANSSCSVRIAYEAAVLNPVDSPGKSNPACGCSCDYPYGAIDLVFVVDTSESMFDEALALCAALPQVATIIGQQGTQVNYTVLGITETPVGQFPCLIDNVLDRFGPEVPNDQGVPIGMLAHPESWADAAAIVALENAWTPGSVRLVVTVSDEAAFEGNGSPTQPCDAADEASVLNAIAVATKNGVIVSTLAGTGSAPCVIALAKQLAGGTGGGSAQTQLPAADLAGIVANFLLDLSSYAGCSSCPGDLSGDGIVNATDAQLFGCLRSFSCLDINNDGVPGGPADQFFVAPANFGNCNASDFCGWTQASCLAPHPTPGCNNTACCVLVCGLEPTCCTVAWDSVCAATARDVCGTCGTIAGSQSCFAANAGPGCSDENCCQLVCAIDPACCAASWDSLCALIARNVCLACGSANTLNCFIPSSLPYCDDPTCCQKVCAIDPFCCDPAGSWDVQCVALARQLCANCGTAQLWPCNELSFAPGCSDKECCETVCNVDPLCCEVTWDAKCVQFANQFCLICGSQLAGSCCVKHANPYCDNMPCCENVCSYDPFCCSSSWDSLCVTLAGILCPTLSCPCGTAFNKCNVTSTRGGCNQALCCIQVCEIDPFCCLVRWDGLCVNFAVSQCSLPDPLNPAVGACVPGTGSCGVSHLTPGCDTPPGCCAIVCAQNLLPECCTVAWDAVCVQAAFNACTNCGNPTAGSCFADNGSAGCADPVCCNAVCNIDPFCCAISWDSACANLAFSLCGDPTQACASNNPLARSCFIASTGRGCRDQTCCNLICQTVDPFCCEVEWDAICAFEATIFCNLASNTSGIGSCFVPHCCGTAPGCTTQCKGCTDRGCASAVCFYLFYCCSERWDAACANMAKSICIDKEECPSSGPCNQPHRQTGCSDPSCCNAVCNFDPHCCVTEWDAACVDGERVYCRPASGWNCPCDGDCLLPNGSPGCRDKACCSAVCTVDASCCEVQWDGSCASLARTICCGLGLCGDSCNKSCLIAHPEPYCNDSHCCTAVCNADPFCCSDSWDTLCVQYAALRCRGTCGQPSSGNCFTENGGTGCRIGTCCKAVCQLDPSCCDDEWDSACGKLAQTVPACIQSKPKCGSIGSGSCCAAHSGPACEEAPCCLAVCGVDPTCCTQEWDEPCATLARTTPQCAAKCNPECGATCAGECCTPHPGPRCNSLECCEAVCFGYVDKELGISIGGDAFCCNVQWDSNCASRANELAQFLVKGGKVVDGPCFKACPQPRCGSPFAGDCCEPHGSPFCLEAECCQTICSLDSYCCEVSWDGNCAIAALSLCDTCVIPLECGQGGSCFFPHFTPFCDNAECCEAVCLINPSCCEVQWDFNCALLAIFGQDTFGGCLYIPTPPSNDDCENPVIVTTGLTPFTNFGATQSDYPTLTVPCGMTSPTEFLADVWYGFVVPQTGTWEITTCNLANFDTALAVYRSDTGVFNCLNGLFLVSCSDNAPFCAQLTSTVQFTGTINQAILIRIGSPIGSTGDGFFLIRKLP